MKALALFVKTPGHSAIKTRLAKEIGAKNAEKFFLLSVECIKDKIDSAPDIHFYWAVAETSKEASDYWVGHSIFQGDGDLGSRQFRVYNQLLWENNKVVLLGADSPQINLPEIQKIYDALDTEDFVFIPARDGGYVAMGGKKPIPQSVWQSVTYSQSTTLAEFSNLLKDKGSVYALNESFDVDTKDDLLILKKYLEDLDKKTDKEIELSDFLESLDL